MRAGARALPWLVALALGGCAAFVGSQQPSEARDDADLAALLSAALPRGAHHCVVARPEQLDREQRRHYLQISQAEPLAWLEALRFSAYATATRERADGSKLRVTLLYVPEGSEAVRATLREHAPVQLRFADDDAEPCEEPSCALPVARFLDDRLLRIDTRDWPDSDATGVETHCQRLVREHADALEVSVRGGSRGVLDASDRAPLLTMRVTSSSEAGVRLVSEDRMASEEAAVQRVEGSGAWFQPPGVAGARIHRERDGSLVTHVTWLGWEDLALAWRDGVRLRSASRLARILGEVVPLEHLDLGDIASLREQLELRLRLLSLVEGEQQQATARELESLVRRAVARHPDHPALRRLEAQVRRALGQGAPEESSEARPTRVPRGP